MSIPKISFIWVAIHNSKTWVPFGNGQVSWRVTCCEAKNYTFNHCMSLTMQILLIWKYSTLDRGCYEG